MHRMNQIGSRLKFYNLHQTLNTSINALNSFTDIYLISSAKFGFVFLISFTSFFLIVIMSSSYIIWDVLSSLLLGACCLVPTDILRYGTKSSQVTTQASPSSLDPRSLEMINCYTTCTRDPGSSIEVQYKYCNYTCHYYFPKFHLSGKSK